MSATNRPVRSFSTRVVPPEPPDGEDATPLVVDVDGTLVAGDLLVEGVFRLIAGSLLRLLVLPIWLARAGSRAALKRRIARAAPLPPDTLALNPDMLDEIESAKASGRQVWLASGSDELVVAPLAEAVGAAGCLASDGHVNLVGTAKAAALVERFGEGGFDYAGNERRDLAVWQRARRAIGVNPSSRLAKALRTLDMDIRFLPGPGTRLLDYFRALRPHQWIKNVLVFLPPVAAHTTSADPYLAALAMFVSLSLCASSTYVFNDLLDLPYDRRHRSKRHRPMAAGKVPLLPMTGVGAALAASGIATAFVLSAEAGICALLYLVVSLTYSLSLKRKIFIDVVTLAGLYALRVFAGGMASSTPLSPWFLAFFTFVFLALAIIKRQSELRGLLESGRSASDGRGWLAEDLPVIGAIGAASGAASVVVFTLYIQSPEVNELYTRPMLLWLLCPLLIHWLGRMTLLANRGTVDDDPVTFAIRDRISLSTGFAAAAVFTAAL